VPAHPTAGRPTSASSRRPARRQHSRVHTCCQQPHSEAAVYRVDKQRSTVALMSAAHCSACAHDPRRPRCNYVLNNRPWQAQRAFAHIWQGTNRWARSPPMPMVSVASARCVTTLPVVASNTAAPLHDAHKHIYSCRESGAVVNDCILGLQYGHINETCCDRADTDI
jgi:hypothetical protein